MSPVQRLMHRDVNHAVGRRSAVPVFFVGWNPHRIAGADFTDRTALGLYPSDAGNDKKRLSERVGMPCGTRAGWAVNLRDECPSSFPLFVSAKSLMVRRRSCAVSNHEDGSSFETRVR